MTPEVQAAIKEIQEAYPGHRVEIGEEPQGGANVIVHDLPIGDVFTPNTTWVGFLITFQYPRADVYPHFIDPAVRRTDGRALDGPFQVSQNFWGRPATQVSRRSNRWTAAEDTATFKLAKVLDWIRNQ
jgi:hypothetical protein